MKHIIAILVAAVLATFTACGDTPAGSDRGDSAGDNQPGAACGKGASGVEPAARVDDGQFVYDVFVELWDENCNVAAMRDVGGAPDGQVAKPLHIFVDGEITGTDGVPRKADYMGGSVKEKDVDAPYHLRAFVKPRNAPHDMVVIANTNRGARPWIGESLDGGFLHCRILRDSAPIRAPRPRDRVSHTVPLEGGAAIVRCHFQVGVG